ncbi:ras-related and estrogen-regulated growth inhibitor-like protein isoform X1 [Perca flavescens]|uniref:ras-related and estrogen-regulated growth inhibitor-like protein isoform X1 n=1 Tax=Perca flavescens TaxID=8167 RepID=UPI00106E32D1|nr:ras-related and estrogen-regulated growth inhibitor-like protein isoform X1 [Perca flavescens]
MNEIKMAVLGSGGVGKSALIVRFLTRRFIGEYSSSSECIYRKRVSVGGKQTNLQLYEPCSQACEGTSTVKEQISWADGFIVVYDISDRSSFLTAKAIMQLIRELRNVDSLIFLVGNKQDLCHRREVQREEAQRLAAQCQGQFYELSAAEHHQELALIFSKMVQNASQGSKAKERRRRPSGSRSMAKLINNVFGKRRKSV